MDEKTKLRKELREKCKALEPAERKRRSHEILKKLFYHPRFVKANSILTYIALESEVETRPLLEEASKEGKKVYVPRMDTASNRIWPIEIFDLSELRAGPYGVREPAYDKKRVGNLGDLDLIVVPGVAFDEEGGRLGRGAGYFDRFLAEASRAYKIGLAFEFQIVKKVPRESHDIHVDEVLIG